jgi:hypothetical protein
MQLHLESPNGGRDPVSPLLKNKKLSISCFRKECSDWYKYYMRAIILTCSTFYSRLYKNKKSMDTSIENITHFQTPIYVSFCEAHTTKNLHRFYTIVASSLSTQRLLFGFLKPIIFFLNYWKRAPWSSGAISLLSNSTLLHIIRDDVEEQLHFTATVCTSQMLNHFNMMQ